MSSTDISFKKYNYISIILLLVLILVYIFENSIFYNHLDYNTYNYYIKPIIWIIIFIFNSSFVPKVHSRSKLKHKEYFALCALICGLIYVAVYMLAGVVNEYGRNPYDLKPKYFLLTIASQLCFICGRESIRYILLNKHYSKFKHTSHFIILIIMTITEIRMISITEISTFRQLVIFISEVLGPCICKNILINYLSSTGSFISTVIYLSIVNLFLFISPVLPSLQWLTTGIVGISVPLFSYMFISNAYYKVTKEYKPYKQKPESVFSWLLTCAFSISLIWFSVGVFPIYPSVIVTGSMEPLIMPGDVTLIEKITNNDELKKLKAGDIIQFKRDDILIVHRIIDIVDDEGMICYKTKGDNNSTEDRELVTAENIKGSLYKVIPKLGLPTLIFRNNENIDLIDIEF